jgi:hypothetical protein
LGQFYKKERLKGVVIILLVNIFLLASLYFVMQGVGQIFVGAGLSGAADATKILDTLQSRSPSARWLLAGFFALWSYAAVDALCAVPKDRDEARKN